MIVNGTPWESHEIGSRLVWVKREDLSCPSPGPSFSKVRGLYRLLDGLRRERFLGPTHIGVVDSIHSKAGWGTAYICQELGIPCTVYYPFTKAEGREHVRPYQQRAWAFGAILQPMPATKSAVLWYQARKDFQRKHPEGYLLPNGLKLTETVLETAQELWTSPLPSPRLMAEDATWVISASSGTIAAGLLRGLASQPASNPFRGKVVIHMGYSRSPDELGKYLNDMAPTARHVRREIVDEGYEYAEAVEYSAPFPCNPFYDMKAWKWLQEEGLPAMPGPVAFWNIGA